MQIAGRSAEGSALFAFGRKSLRHAIKSRIHCFWSQEASVAAEKELEGTVRMDKLLVNGTEWPSIGREAWAYGECQLIHDHITYAESNHMCDRASFVRAVAPSRLVLCHAG